MSIYGELNPIAEHRIPEAFDGTRENIWPNPIHQTWHTLVNASTLKYLSAREIM